MHHLPEEVIHILRDSRDDASGVFHLAVLPMNGKTRTADFGAGLDRFRPAFPQRRAAGLDEIATERRRGLGVRGRDHHRFHRSVCLRRDPAGQAPFVLFPWEVGPHLGPLGPAVRTLDINTAAHNFGRIDLRHKTVTVQVTGRPPDDARVDLHYYAASPSRCTSPRSHTVPEPSALLSFENIAPGEYDIALSPNQWSRCTSTASWSFRRTIGIRP